MIEQEAVKSGRQLDRWFVGTIFVWFFVQLVLVNPFLVGSIFSKKRHGKFCLQVEKKESRREKNGF